MRQAVTSLSKFGGTSSPQACLCSPVYHAVHNQSGCRPRPRPHLKNADCMRCHLMPSAGNPVKAPLVVKSVRKWWITGVGMIQPMFSASPPAYDCNDDVQRHWTMQPHEHVG